MLPWCLGIIFFANVGLFTKDVSSEVIEPVISTKAGVFQGIKLIPPGKETAVDAFLGIPYAKPPVGSERFNKPKPMDFIPGVFIATKKPPSCFQLDRDMPFPWADKESTMSEDCLYLNVWAPEKISTEDKLKPVMVWVHGGGFTVGSSGMDLYDGQVLSAFGEVLVVTFNYRLSSFGFLNSLTDDAPGNMALYDQLLALQWVQSNVKYFGGDPMKVTIFGESVGAMCSGFLALSPLSKGLFQRIIMQSGSSYSPLIQSPLSVLERGIRLSKLVNCSNNTFTLVSNPKEVVTCLKGVQPTDLKKMYHKNDSSEEILIFQPHFWSEIIPNHPLDTLKSQNFTSYEVLVGVIQVEGSALFAHLLGELYPKFIEGNITMTKPLAVVFLQVFFKEFNFTHAGDIIEYYLRDVGNDEQDIVRAMCELIGDYMITCPAVYFAEKYSQRGVKVYFYRFDHRPSTSPWPEWMGATHFEDVKFVFGLPIRHPEKYQGGERSLSEYMIRTWTNFAKYEDLTLKNGSLWPTYSRLDSKYVILQTNQQIIGSDERKAQCDFWRQYFKAD